MTYDTQGRRIIGPQSTFEGECKALRAENERLRANLRDSEDAVNWAVMTKNMATDEVNQLRARVAELEAALRFYADGHWHEDYPGGVLYAEVGDEHANSLDYGDKAREALEATPQRDNERK